MYVSNTQFKGPRGRHEQPLCIRHSSQFGTFAHFHDFRVHLADLIVVYASLVVVAVLVC
jgi:hypothetical protein